MTRDGATKNMLDALAQPTPAEEVRQRQGNRQHDGNCDKRGGVCQLPHNMLDYVDARFVMDRLDGTVGPENWQDQFVDRPDGSVRAGIGILVEGEWVWKWDVGDPSDIEATKGSYSDAFKRAGVKWGIARDLYGHDPVPVAQPARARSFQPPQDAPRGGDYVDADQAPAAPRCAVCGALYKGNPGDYWHRAEDGTIHRPAGQRRRQG